MKNFFNFLYINFVWDNFMEDTNCGIKCIALNSRVHCTVWFLTGKIKYIFSEFSEIKIFWSMSWIDAIFIFVLTQYQCTA